MFFIKLILSFLLLLGIPAVGYVAYTATQPSGSSGGSSSGSSTLTLHNAPPVSITTPTHGVPGPIAGAGLPILAVGYGVYWLVRRRRRSQ
jgi:hypothetical protein